MSAPFISSDDLANYLHLDDETELLSGLALIALDAACERVRGFVGQPLDSTTDTNYWLDGNGQPRLVLPRFPVEVSALSVYDDRTDTDPEVLVLNTDYVVDEEAGIVTRIDGYVFERGAQNIKVTYTHGYATVPSDARLVALQVAARIYEVGQVENESVGGVSQTYVKGAGNLTLDEKDVLRRYRR